LGTKEEVLLSSLKAYKKDGLIRRFGAILDHRKIGRKANALVAWRVKRSKINFAGRLMAKLPQITHCYVRRSYSHWPYNLYAMIHASERKDILRLIKMISQKIKTDDCRVLFTLREFKKKRVDLMQGWRG
jgi:DNA-binding Lrp family transcriptional regulator